jgi:signal transduction histidine kinase
MADIEVASVAAIGRIGIVPRLLDICCSITGMGFAAIARVTEDRWVACATLDRLGFGLTPGDELEIETTLCNEIRDHRRPIVIDDVAQDPAYREHQTPRIYGLQSYISMPILLADGSFWGTLCAIDPQPHRVSDATVVGTFKAFAELIAMHLDTQARLELSEAALEDERATGDLRDRFVAVLGHDLRNPLAALDAGTRLLSGTQLDERQAKIVTQMAASTRRMSQLIDHMLDLARGRLGGGLAVERAEDLGLAADIVQVIDELRAVHPARALELDLGPIDSVPCDHQRMMQLVSNLLANALTHGDPAQPVRVAARLDKGSFRFEVANGGKPIPKTRIAKLFEPFNHSGDKKGLGLGLFIAMEIARAHGGTIHVASDADETRFTFVMPCDAPVAADCRT